MASPLSLGKYKLEIDAYGFVLKNPIALAVGVSKNHIDNQNKVERPELSYDQLMILNETVHIKIANHEPTLIEYWKQGYFYQQVAFIKEVNILEKQLIIANEQGNETLKIPMEDIKRIE